MDDKIEQVKNSTILLLEGVSSCLAKGEALDFERLASRFSRQIDDIYNPPQSDEQLVEEIVKYLNQCFHERNSLGALRNADNETFWEVSAKTIIQKVRGTSK
jgi:hypothetical protein